MVQFVLGLDDAAVVGMRSNTALSRMMSNSSAVIASNRKLLAGVVQSILRYGGSIWSKVLSTIRNLRRLESTHRIMCLRIASAYRTISKEAVLSLRLCWNRSTD